MGAATRTLAGQPAPAEMLIDVAGLEHANPRQALEIGDRPLARAG